MHSETQTLREGSATHPSAPRVRHQSVSEDPISLADDAKTFRVAVVIGLVMVGGLSLFLPDKTAGPTYEVMTPESLKGLDLAQHASTDSERTQTNIVELREGKKTAGQAEIRAQLATLDLVVPSPMVEKRQASTPKPIPVVRTPALQTDVVSLQR
jgi:hypothetical protein